MLVFSPELCLRHVQHPVAKAAPCYFQSRAEKSQFPSGMSRIHATTWILVQHVLHKLLKDQGVLELTLKWGSSLLKTSGVLQQVQMDSFGHMCGAQQQQHSFSSVDTSKFKLQLV